MADDADRLLAAIRRRTLGSRLRQARAAARRSQREVAELAGVDPTYYRQIERGTKPISMDRLWRLADALDVHPVELLAG